MSSLKREILHIENITTRRNDLRRQYNQALLGGAKTLASLKTKIDNVRLEAGAQKRKIPPKKRSGGKFPEVVYVIPSYNRINTIVRQTLSFLEEYNIPKDEIYIFVANKSEYKIYSDVLSPLGYRNIIIGVLGLKKVIRFIQNYFPNGQKIFHINDDVRGLKQCNGQKKMVPIKSLKNVVKRGFRLLRENNLQLFGFYPIVNDYFQCGQREVTTGLRFIVGSIYGYINDKSMISKTSIVLKEDYERCLSSYTKYGGVLRFTHIGIVTTYANATGGVSALRKTGGREKKESFLLKKLYPNLVHFVNRKRVQEGFKFDIRIKD